MDRIVAAKAEEVRAQLAAVEPEGSQSIEAERRRLDAVEGELRGQLRKLTAGIQIPG